VSDDPRSAPLGQGRDQLLDHSFDGITEYDNPLPRWWVALFWLTIVFLPLYVIYYHFGPGELPLQRYDAEMVAHYEQQAAELLALGEINDEMLRGLQDSPSMMSGAEKVFESRCAVCHGMFGEGGIGPNLTDDHWLHGGRLTDIYTTIKNGVPSKGMLAWEGQLKPAELLAVAAFVGSRVGSEPPNAKAPQGELFVATKQEAAADAGEQTGQETTPSEP